MFKPVRGIDRISAHIDHSQNITEFVGTCVTTTNLDAKGPFDDRVTIPAGTAVPYRIQEYRNSIDDKEPFTILTLYYTFMSKSYRFTDSTASDLDTAARMWGLDNYR